MPKQPATFLEKIQNADHGTKRIYLVVTCAVVMLLITVIWVSYFNSIVRSVNAPVAVEGTTGGVSFLDTAKSGLATIYNIVLDSLKDATRAFRSPKDYIINPDGQ